MKDIAAIDVAIFACRWMVLPADCFAQPARMRRNDRGESPGLRWLPWRKRQADGKDDSDHLGPAGGLSLYPASRLQARRPQGRGDHAPIARAFERDDMLAIAEYFSKKPWPISGQPPAPKDVAERAQHANGSVGCTGCHLASFQGDGTRRAWPAWAANICSQTMLDFRTRQARQQSRNVGPDAGDVTRRPRRARRISRGALRLRHLSRPSASSRSGQRPSARSRGAFALLVASASGWAPRASRSSAMPPCPAPPPIIRAVRPRASTASIVPAEVEQRLPDDLDQPRGLGHDSSE